MLKIALVQSSFVVGDFKRNLQKIRSAYQRACAENADILVTPELSLSGYLLLDFVYQANLFRHTQTSLDELCEMTRGQRCCLVVGHILPQTQSVGRTANNVVSVFENAQLVFRQTKVLLPNYDIFDETRYFEAGKASEIEAWVYRGSRIGLAICEDLWGEETFLGKRLYKKGLLECFRQQNIDLLISLSASPYQLGKRDHREALHGEVARSLKIPLIYVNQVGATDEVLFDGNSFMADAAGQIVHRSPAFQEDFACLELSQKFAPLNSVQDPLRELSEGLVVGIQQYFENTGSSRALLGISGGIDSAVVAALAVRALGAQSVVGVAMPSPYSSSHSLEDAEALVKGLGIRMEMHSIKFFYSIVSRYFKEYAPTADPLVFENLQSRLRGLILMALANIHGSLVLNTGNKSELSMGYCTLYGDMIGALSPLGDLVKTRVYEVARYINQHWNHPIPERCLQKAPSAELRFNQTDQDTLPPYDVLDRVLIQVLEERNFDFQGLDEKTVQWILKRLNQQEFKRRQAPFVLRVTPQAFGMGRRVPISHRFE